MGVGHRVLVDIVGIEGNRVQGLFIILHNSAGLLASQPIWKLPAGMRISSAMSGGMAVDVAVAVDVVVAVSVNVGEATAPPIAIGR